MQSEKICDQYHTLRIFKPFKEEWNKFLLTSLCQPALLTFYQYISHFLFNSLLELKLKFTEIDHINKSEATCPTTLEEENALCYVAGCVCCKVRDEIIKSSVKDKEELILFCFELCGDEDCKCGMEEWTNLIDRGGLWHINDCAYTVFSILEDLN